MHRNLLKATTGAALISFLAIASSTGHSMPLETLPHGKYVCAVPGDASGPAWRVIPNMVIEIRNASSYRTPSGNGTYLETGQMVIFTRGPWVNERYEQIGKRTLRRISKDGTPGKIHCLKGLLTSQTSPG